MPYNSNKQTTCISNNLFIFIKILFIFFNMIVIFGVKNAFLIKISYLKKNNQYEIKQRSIIQTNNK